MKDMDNKVQEVYRTPNRCENEKKIFKTTYCRQVVKY